jgi:hypothetical protein
MSFENRVEVDMRVEKGGLGVELECFLKEYVGQSQKCKCAVCRTLDYSLPENKLVASHPKLATKETLKELKRKEKEAEEEEGESERRQTRSQKKKKEEEKGGSSSSKGSWKDCSYLV